MHLIAVLGELSVVFCVTDGSSSFAAYSAPSALPQLLLLLLLNFIYLLPFISGTFLHLPPPASPSPPSFLLLIRVSCPRGKVLAVVVGQVRLRGRWRGSGTEAKRNGVQVECVRNDVIQAITYLGSGRVIWACLCV